VAKGPGRGSKDPGAGPDPPPRWGALFLGWKGRLLAVVFTAMIVVMGFALHGSIVGRLVEGAVFVTSIVVLWMTGTRPAHQPGSDRAPSPDVDR